ncbi:MAG: DUF3025 domain-containing protein [Proteobacteria bacterium]|nr:DUF3025 domain-containing protein [Pseudomonadota bacterium]
MDYPEGRKKLLEGKFCEDIKVYLLSLNASNWPTCEELNRLVTQQSEAILNLNGTEIQFVPQLKRPKIFEAGFEQRTFLTGEVQVRSQNWHDLLNALVWFLFPKSKAALNARHFAVLQHDAARGRSPQGDALTIFDEDGVIVVSRNPGLTRLLKELKWVDIFYESRGEVMQDMSFRIFGHALLEKSMNPYVGMTGKALIIEDPKGEAATCSVLSTAAIDAELSQIIPNLELFGSGRNFSPLPMLGLPGCWEDNEKLEFFLNDSYFRPKRSENKKA